jgi:uncharacterized NAD(P)/FAD-binding protein YdhS
VPPLRKQGRQKLTIAALKKSAAEVKLLEESFVAIVGSALEVIKQLATTCDHHQKTAP